MADSAVRPRAAVSSYDKRPDVMCTEPAQRRNMFGHPRKCSVLSLHDSAAIGFNRCEECVVHEHRPASECIDTLQLPNHFARAA